MGDWSARLWADEIPGSSLLSFQAESGQQQAVWWYRVRGGLEVPAVLTAASSPAVRGSPSAARLLEPRPAQRILSSQATANTFNGR